MRYDDISTESMILLLLCSYLPLNRSDEPTLTPFSPVEWHKIREQIPDDKLPNLFDYSSDKITSDFNISVETSARIESLLKLGGNLALELERLEQKGIWILTECDDSYPIQFREKLKYKAPPVIFGAGDESLLNEGGVGIVGSRDVDSDGQKFTEDLSQLCAREGLNVISGAARGVDRIAMSFALEAGGKVVGVLADSLEKFLSASQIRESVIDGNLTVVTHLHPSAGFSISAAMSRNKLIYSLSDYTVIVSSDYDKGGTWAGAIEALNHQYAPVFVRHAEKVPDGNLALIKKGAMPIPNSLDFNIVEYFASQIAIKTEQDSINKSTDDLPQKETKKIKHIQQSLFPDDRD